MSTQLTCLIRKLLFEQEENSKQKLDPVEDNGQSKLNI